MTLLRKTGIVGDHGFFYALKSNHFFYYICEVLAKGMQSRKIQKNINF